MAGEAPILLLGRHIGEMLLPIGVAPDAEVCPLDGAETEAVIVVVTRRAQTTAHVPGGRVTDETPGRRRGGGESILPERRPCRAVAVKGALESAGEVLAGQRLLVLGLVAGRARGVLDRLRELGMTSWRVALPTTNALHRVTTLRVVRDGRRGVTGRTVFDVGDGPREGLRVRPRRRRQQQETAGGSQAERGPEEASHEPGPRPEDHAPSVRCLARKAARISSTAPSGLVVTVSIRISGCSGAS